MDPHGGGVGYLGLPTLPSAPKQTCPHNPTHFHISHLYCICTAHSDCAHLLEPGCSVTAQEENLERYPHYVKMLLDIKVWKI